MKRIKMLVLPFVLPRATDGASNDNDALIPELWAQEALILLEENMVMGNLVYRDFEDKIAKYGDIVNAHRPGTFTAVRKDDTENVTVQAAATTNVPVPLNQHFHTSFMIMDGEESKSFKDLVQLFLYPAVLSIAQAVDRVMSGQCQHFIFANGSGTLGTGPTNTTPVLNVRNEMNKNKAPVTGRNFVVTPNTETDLLKLELFISAEKVGDEGTALREANLGRKLGFDFFMAQNQPSIIAVADTGTATATATTIKTGLPALAGATTVYLTSGAAIVAGQMVAIAGDPQLVLSIDTSPTDDTMVIYPGLRADVAALAAVDIYNPSILDGLHAAAAHGELTIQTVTGLSVGQIVLAQGAAAATTSGAAAVLPHYTVIATDGTTGITVDRPLDAALADNAILSMYPLGEYNFAFNRNAIALVTRPLAVPRSGTGALAAVANFNGLSIRVVITYNGTQQGHLVTVDMLCGTAMLDVNLGAVMFG